MSETEPIKHGYVKPKVGDTVEVFNQVADNFKAEVVAVNKATVRVRSNVTFTNHPMARPPYDFSDQYLVPFKDILKITNRPIL